MPAKAALWLRRLLGAGLLLAVWQLASLHFPPLVVPPISSVLERLVILVQDPAFWPTVGKPYCALLLDLASV